KIDEGERVPAVLELQRGGPALQYFRGCGVDFRKDGVRADAAEPIASVAGVGLLAVQNAVPETAFRSFEILTQGVALIETGKVEPEAAERALGAGGSGKQVLRGGRGQYTFRLRDGARAACERQQPFTVLVKRENACDVLPVSCWIEYTHQVTIVPCEMGRMNH